MKRLLKGYSLIELIAIMVIVSVLAITASSRFMRSTSAELQASRDSLVAALFAAQQRAMAQTDDVRVQTSGTSVDVQQYVDGGWQSVRVGNVLYPLNLTASVSNQTVTYNRLGQTEAGGTVTITLNQSGSSANVQVYTSGFVE